MIDKQKARPWARSDHVVELTEQTIPIIQKLNLAVRYVDSALDDLVEVEGVLANDFWRRTAGLQGKP